MNRQNFKEQITTRRQLVIFFSLVFLLIVILLCLNYCKSSVSDTSSGLVYEISDEAEIDDSTPLSDGSKKKIVFPGFSTKTISYSRNKPMSLQNPRANTVDFVYTVVYEESEVYVSDKIEPGQTEKWNLHEVFTESGEYEITILITPFDKSGAEKNGFKQNFKFSIV